MIKCIIMYRERVINMKIKKWHLFVIIILLFSISFFVVNLKFDKFYRLNDINNDNRVLIESYLDEKEQQYLIDNQIPIKEFVDLIVEDDFNLYNYQYYNLLKQTQRYASNTQLVKIGNNMSAKLDYLFDDPIEKAKLIIDSKLELDFVGNQNFNLEYIHMYLMIKPLYLEEDYSYIDDLFHYIEKLKVMGINNNLDKVIESLCQSYDKKELDHLFSKVYDNKETLVLDPNNLLTLVNDYNYIGEYTPKDLLLTQNLPRKNYSMYLRKDAYLALVSMYQELSKENKSFVLLEAFNNYDSLLRENKKAGYDETQLGLTVCISQKGIAYEHFIDTDMCKWLENNAYRFGFIQRYPKHKASSTNHSYDPHIYRFVGKEAAEKIYNLNITLEEYHSLLN